MSFFFLKLFFNFESNIFIFFQDISKELNKCREDEASRLDLSNSQVRKMNQKIDIQWVLS